MFLASKFPEVVSLYGNASIFKKENGELPNNMCELIHTFHEDIDGSTSSPVANYLNPISKLILVIKCPSKDLKILINKSFTSILSFIVGEDVKVPENYVKLSDIKLLR